jgi:heparosan-N-sulfate-glucuronate 5-epimerase
MSLARRFRYYGRIIPAYLGGGRSQLTFWHESPALNPKAFAENGGMFDPARLGAYYMLFREKADYAGHYDSTGIPMLDYRGAIGLQYNPIAVAQWGLGNYNRFVETGDESRVRKVLQAADWLTASLEENPYGLRVWNHHFDWEYRDTLHAPWYSGLSQGQGISLLLRAYHQSKDTRYLKAAELAFVPLTKPMAEGGVLFEDQESNLWIEEYLVDPPTHILNGFIWALWGVFDFWLAGQSGVLGDAQEARCREARRIFDCGVQTLLSNLSRYDTGYWSLYEQSGTRLRMLASPFYHRLHGVQLRVMAILTGSPAFSEYAERWHVYENDGVKCTRALFEKGLFKLIYY